MGKFMILVLVLLSVPIFNLYYSYHFFQETYFKSKMGKHIFLKRVFNMEAGLAAEVLLGEDWLCTGFCKLMGMGQAKEPVGSHSKEMKKL